MVLLLLYSAGLGMPFIAEASRRPCLPLS